MTILIASINGKTLAAFKSRESAMAWLVQAYGQFLDSWTHDEEGPEEVSYWRFEGEIVTINPHTLF